MVHCVSKTMCSCMEKTTSRKIYEQGEVFHDIVTTHAGPHSLALGQFGYIFAISIYLATSVAKSTCMNT